MRVCSAESVCVDCDAEKKRVHLFMKQICPSIHLSIIHTGSPLTGGGRLEPIIADVGRVAGNTLDRPPVYHRADIWWQTTTHTYTGNLESPINLTWPVWDEAREESRGEHENITRKGQTRPIQTYPILILIYSSEYIIRSKRSLSC